MPGTKKVTKEMLPRSSRRAPELSVEKMTRKSSGKANVNTAPAGLRQNAFCSNRSWRRAILTSLTGGLGGQFQVDVLQRGPGDGEAVEGDAPFERPTGEHVEGGGGIRGSHDDAPPVHRHRRRPKLRELRRRR